MRTNYKGDKPFKIKAWFAYANRKGELFMPLTIAPAGRELKIIKVLIEEGTKRHLENLGLIAGATLEVLSGDKGSVIVKVKDGRLALNKEVATKIFVA